MDDMAGRISESELEVMRVLWEAAGPLTITDIRRSLQQRKDWESTTIKTLVQRLCVKGAVEQVGCKPFLYRPLIGEQEYSRWATGDLIRRLYRGSARDLVAALVSSDSLSDEDVEELRGFFKMEEGQ